MRQYLPILFVCLLYACANPMAPSGGMKDVDPPKVLVQMPASGSVNYQGKQIVLLFDEYITFNGGEDKIIITPSMPEKPKYIVKGKKLIIKLPDNLDNNLTYSISLLDAVSDYTEGNTLGVLRHVFATGSEIDSSSISGTVIGAYDLTPIKNVFVGLYLSSDSVNMKSKPLYLSRTNDAGQFRLDYVKEGSYILGAIEDKNFNYIFDQANERLSIPSEEIFISGDMVLEERVLVFNNETNVIVDGYKLLNNNKLYFNFSKSVENLALDVDGFMPSDKVYFSSANDTLFYHWTNDTLTKLTFNFELDGVTKDTVVVPITKNTMEDRLVLVENINLGQDILVNGYKYIESFSIDGISLKDTLGNDLNFSVKMDKEFLLITNLEPMMGFVVLKIDSGTVNFYNNTVNSKGVETRIAVNEALSRSNLNLIFDPVTQSNIYLQLMNKDKQIVEMFLLDGKSKLDILDIAPGTYNVRVFHDLNANGIWNTGSLENGLWPEPTLLWSSPIEVKENWDKEIKLSF